MAKYLKLFMVALFAAMTFALTSCGDDDEPDNPNGNGKDYSFDFNNTPYYYGCDYLWAGIDGMDMTELLSHFSQDYDKEFTSLFITAFDTPFRMFDENGEMVMEQDATMQLEGSFFVDYINPKSLKKGDILHIQNHLRTDTEWDVSTTLKLENIKTSTSEYFGRNEDVPGCIKFISFEENVDDMGTDYLTLEFENMTFYRINVFSDDEYSPLDKSKKGVINGKVVFSSRRC